DGIRDGHVTGVQTCALPIYSLRYRYHPGAKPIQSWSSAPGWETRRRPCPGGVGTANTYGVLTPGNIPQGSQVPTKGRPRETSFRSEERRVGKECRYGRASK